MGIELASILQGVLARPVFVVLVVWLVPSVFLVPSAECFQRLEPVVHLGMLCLVGRPLAPHR